MQAIINVINECEIEPKLSNSENSNSENSKTKFMFSFGNDFIFNADNIKSSNMITEEMYELKFLSSLKRILESKQHFSA